MLKAKSTVPPHPQTMVERREQTPCMNATHTARQPRERDIKIGDAHGLHLRDRNTSEPHASGHDHAQSSNRKPPEPDRINFRSTQSYIPG